MSGDGETERKVNNRAMSGDRAKESLAEARRRRGDESEKRSDEREEFTLRNEISVLDIRGSNGGGGGQKMTAV
jgi:hypothetical protein